MNTSTNKTGPGGITRRNFVQRCAAGAAALTAAPMLGCRSVRDSSNQTGPTSRIVPLDRDWLFEFNSDPGAANFEEAQFSHITLPHCVAKLSWQNWDPAVWQKVWMYRRHFRLPEDARGRRVFLEFDGVMVGATPTVNGHTLPTHLGGYLPFRYEVTEWVTFAENVLALAVDSRWSNVPPEGSPVGPKRVDYLEAGGIHRSVRLRIVPQIFIRDVFAKPVDVLGPKRRVEVTCSIDAAGPIPKSAQLRVELMQGGHLLSGTCEEVALEKLGQTEARLTLGHLGSAALWDVDAPNRCEVVATLLIDGQPVHDYRVRTGLREARFELDGFYLNGRRLQLFGLNRHEVYPYVGYAMPPRVKRHDAEMLRRQFNCNIVRCSHYPQSEAFLDACDELGLMVWEEVPGWGYLGDDPWKELLVRDVKDMIVRDRNHPAIVIWGTRVNESANDVELYRKTKALAKSLDDSRPTSGSMTGGTRKNWKQDWHEDVFAFDDYQAEEDGTVKIAGPVEGFPYMLAEAVGQFNYTARKGFECKYRRAGDVAVQQAQALRHAQAHSKVGRNPRICGLIAWCGFDYSSLVNPHNNVKCPGVADVFRIPKLGATFYEAQIDPKIRPVILPNFYWDFGAQTARGPGKGASIFSNCDRLVVFVNGQAQATLRPDAANYPHLKHPPFFVDLELDGTSHPELRIDGYVGGQKVLSRSFSSDPGQDQLFLQADDAEISGDGADATRLVFKVVDKFGAERLLAGGTVSFEITGPGEIVGDNPFSLADSGGVGAIWIKAKASGSGTIRVAAQHSSLGKKAVAIRVSPVS